jgi:hypothetical protein
MDVQLFVMTGIEAHPEPPSEDGYPVVVVT